ncbi:YHS domain-containing protein [Salinimicrobium sp. CAU 1759]
MKWIFVSTPRKINFLIILLILITPLLTLTSCSSSRVDLAQGQHMDPVCGIAVSEQSAINYKYMENTYYFDSEQCLTVFRKNPEKFQNTQKRRSTNGMHMGWAPISGIVMVLGMTAAMIIGISH